MSNFRPEVCPNNCGTKLECVDPSTSPSLGLGLPLWSCSTCKIRWGLIGFEDRKWEDLSFTEQDFMEMERFLNERV